MIQALFIINGYLVTWETDGMRTTMTAPMVGLALLAVASGLSDTPKQALVPVVLHEGLFTLVPGGKVSPLN